MSVRLINVYDYDESERHRLLWQLLEERPAEASISHARMPEWDEHVAFIERRPYAAWYFIAAEDDTDRVMGSVYVSIDKSGHLSIRCIGIAVFKIYHGKGVGRQAITELRRIHKGTLYANIAPNNERSKAFFAALGFEKIQETWKL